MSARLPFPTLAALALVVPGVAAAEASARPGLFDRENLDGLKTLLKKLGDAGAPK